MNPSAKKILSEGVQDVGGLFVLVGFGAFPNAEGNATANIRLEKRDIASLLLCPSAYLQASLVPELSKLAPSFVLRKIHWLFHFLVLEPELEPLHVPSV